MGLTSTAQRRIPGTQPKIPGSETSQTPDKDGWPVRLEQVYFIKNKSSRKIAQSGSTAAGASIVQNDPDGSISQKIMFEKVDGNYFYIRTLSGGHYWSLVGDGRSVKLIQDVLYTKNIGAKTPTGQHWKLVPSGESTCFFLVNRNMEDRVIAPLGTNNGAILSLSPRNGSDTQKWLFNFGSTENHPDSKDAEIGLINECYATLTAFYFFSERENIGHMFPEWRSVGETVRPNGTTVPPAYNYKILEGRVIRDKVNMAREDLPLAHFTHDFIFHVKPDPYFNYLLGIQDGAVQSDIEVEWESGIAQGNHERINPAAPYNRKGDSFGFYSAGHRRQQLLWNWPTANDWVHVEGQWVWDRGHPPARTEIHPPRLVAIQRYLPEKFIPDSRYSDRYYFSTRCDIYAGGDGNVIWNNKGLHPFTQRVRMSGRSYFMVFKHDLPKPNANAKLRYAWENHSGGDTFTAQPVVTVYEAGTADIPVPHVTVEIPWANSGVPDAAIFARTLHLYWDDLPTHGIPASYAMRKISILFDKIIIHDKQEGSDLDPGEYRLFSDVGGNWSFLNEFVGVNDILSYGLGRVWDVNFSRNHPNVYQPGDAHSEFSFAQPYEIYLPEGKEFRLQVSGWEADYMDNQFGRIINPYISCEEGKKFTSDNFDGSDFVGQGSLDDPAGEVRRFFSYPNAISQQIAEFSTGSVVYEPGPVSDSDPRNNYQAIIKMWSSKMNEPSRFKVTLEKIECISVDDDGGQEEPYGKLAVYLSSDRFGLKLKNEDFGKDQKGVIPHGSNILFDRDADHNLSLRAGEVAQLDVSRIFEFSPSDDPNAYFTIWGDLDEEDGFWEADDKLEKYKETDEKITASIRRLPPNVIQQRIQRFGSGGTELKVYYTIQHLPDIP